MFMVGQHECFLQESGEQIASVWKKRREMHRTLYCRKERWV